MGPAGSNTPLPAETRVTGTIIDQSERRLDAPALARGAGDTVLLWAALALALVPVVYLVFSSFNVADIGQPYVFGLDNWSAAASSSGTGRAIANTLLLSTRVIFAFVAALAISWAIVRLEIPGRRFVQVSLWVAFFLPSVPVAMAWILLLHKDYGLVNLALQYVPFLPKHIFSIHSFGGIMWVYATIATTPFLAIVFTPVFRQMDAAFEEVARVNGANRLQTFARIVLPTLFPALLVGLLATFIRSLESFEVEQLVGAPARIFVFTTRIYDLTREVPPLYNQAMTLGTLFLAVALALAALQGLYMARHPTSVTVRGRSARAAISSRRSVRIAGSAIAIGFVIIAIYLPLGVLLVGSFTKVFGFFGMRDPWTPAHWLAVLTDTRFLGAVRTSFVFGLCVAIVAVPLYLRLAFIIARSAGSRQGAIASALIWLPWAVPGFVFGLSVLDILLRVDFLAPLYGTAAPIVFAMLIKEMPIGVQLLRVAVEQHGREFEDAAAVAGAGRWQTLRRITLPMLSPTLMAVFIIVFAGVMKEIGTIVMLSGPGTETLSMLMFDYANEGHRESAAVIGVLFALGSTLLAVAVNRRIVLTGPQ